MTGYIEKDYSEDSYSVILTNSINNSSVITNIGERILDKTDLEANIPNVYLFEDFVQ